MKYRILLSISLLALPLGAQEADRKPSPFPEKEQKLSQAEEKARVRSTASARTSAPRPRGMSSADAPDGVEVKDTGEACFFSKSANGGLTASGIRLNSEELVAAHASFPLKSRVRVTNLANGKTVDVQIVDRFPVSKRIISVSEAAARQLGFISSGTAEVKLDPIPQGAESRVQQ